MYALILMFLNFSVILGYIDPKTVTFKKNILKGYCGYCSEPGESTKKNLNLEINYFSKVEVCNWVHKPIYHGKYFSF